MYDNFAVTSQSRQSCRQQSPSSETAIMLALLARRVRDAELHSQQQHLNDDFVQAMLAKLQSANGSSTLSGESSNVGRCSDFGLVSEQPSWVLKHGTTATGCDVTRLWYVYVVWLIVNGLVMILYDFWLQSAN